MFAELTTAPVLGVGHDAVQENAQVVLQKNCLLKNALFGVHPWEDLGSDQLTTSAHGLVSLKGQGEMNYPSLG